MKTSLFGLILFIFSSCTSATIYKCQVNGKRVFADQPCSFIKNTAQRKTSESTLSFDDKIIEPYQYLGKPKSEIANIFNVTHVDDNIVIINEKKLSVQFQSDNRQHVQQISIDIKHSTPCDPWQDFDSSPLLTQLGIKPTEVTLMGKMQHIHKYYDKQGKYKVYAQCAYRGAPYSLVFNAL